MSTKMHVGCSPLTHRIYAGRLARDEESWAGKPTEVTIPALVAVAEHIVGHGKPSIITCNGIPTWEISVRVIAPPPAPMEAAR